MKLTTIHDSVSSLFSLLLWKVKRRTAGMAHERGPRPAALSFT
ncbi:hypothetical protein RR42_m3297 [Cupriavidus basilensis]|uniref:Uncharacterized protein n=1 Tax=Cupriavidus basilensis TaxID=68895 RepID=A0A0C4YD29_9BURK|nr:hypothetical protein RR42_m3297 [Cupriavidus basilensis]